MSEKPASDRQILLQFKDDFAKFREDLSAVAMSSDNYLWLASDETASVERLSKVENDRFENQELFPIGDFIDLPGKIDEEIDIEGLDYADNYIWLVGSHSIRRSKPKKELTDLENITNLAILKPQKNRYFLARIPCVGDRLFRECQHPENPEIKLTAASLERTKKGNLLTEALEKDPHIGSFLSMNLPAKENGFDIEGLAVYKNKVFLGLRGPVLRGWAIILELEIKENNAGNLKLKKWGENRYRKHFLDLKGLGVRDLCVDGEDLLILAGPTMDIDGPVKVYKLENVVDLPENTMFKPEPILDIPFGDGEDHAEGITLFSRETQKSLLVVYDSPAKTRLKGDSGILADVFTL